MENGNTDVTPDGNGKQKRIVSAIVLEAVEKMPGTYFSTKDILSAIQNEYPVDNPSRRANVSNSIKRLCKAGHGFELVKQGAGSRPSKYRIIKKSTQPNFGQMKFFPFPYLLFPLFFLLAALGTISSTLFFAFYIGWRQTARKFQKMT